MPFGNSSKKLLPQGPPSSRSARGAPRSGGIGREGFSFVIFVIFVILVIFVMKAHALTSASMFDGGNQKNKP